MLIPLLNRPGDEVCLSGLSLEARESVRQEHKPQQYDSLTATKGTRRICKSHSAVYARIQKLP